MRIVGSHLAKFLKNPCLVFRGDADAGVTDGDFYSAVGLPGINSNPSALRGELHRVGKQIEQYLLDLALITDVLAKTLVNGNVNLDAVLGGTLAHKGACVVYCQGKIKRSQLKLHPTSFNLGKIENLIYQGQKM